MKIVPSIRRISLYHLLLAILLALSGVFLLDNLVLSRAVKNKYRENRREVYEQAKRQLRERMWLISNFIFTQHHHSRIPQGQLKRQVISLMQHNRFPDGEYFFAGKENGDLLSFSYYKHHLPPLSGFLTEKTIRTRLLPAKHKGIYLTYKIKISADAESRKKISLIKWFPPIKLFIGTGMMIDDIEKKVRLRNAPLLKERAKIRPMLWLILVIMSALISLILHSFISKITNDFRILHDYLKKININMDPIKTRDLKFREFKALAMDANWMTRKLRRFTLNLERMLDEKGLLLKEIHHRVKNNFQIVSSIIGIQSSSIKNPEVQHILNKCDRRIRSLALAHEKIYNSPDFTSVLFEEYASTLMLMLTQSHPEHSGRVVYDIPETPLSLSLEQAIPCAIILNELAENAFCHAFPNKGTGSILVSLHKIAERSLFKLTISDTGKGLPEYIDPLTCDSLGFTLVRLLISQIRGEMIVDKRDRGTTISITFPQ